MASLSLAAGTFQPGASVSAYVRPAVPAFPGQAGALVGSTTADGLGAATFVGLPDNTSLICRDTAGNQAIAATPPVTSVGVGSAVVDDATVGVLPSVAGKADKSANLGDLANATRARLLLRIAMLTPSVVVATTNVNRSGLTTIDGFPLRSGDQVLLTAQADATKNGIWTAGTGGWSRPADFLDGDSIRARVTAIIAGSQHAQELWMMTNVDPVVVGVAQSWAPINGGGGGGGVAITFQDESVSLTQRATLDVQGAGATLTDTGTKLVLTVPGASGGLAGTGHQDLVIPQMFAGDTYYTQAFDGIPAWFASAVAQAVATVSTAGTLFFQTAGSQAGPWTTVDTGVISGGSATVDGSANAAAWRVGFTATSNMTSAGALDIDTTVAPPS